MTPVKFPEANSRFGPPEDLAESQCMTIWAYSGTVAGGSVDGAHQVVVAWLPDEQERKRIADGGPIFLSVIGGLPPHYLSTSFAEAIKPA